VKKTVWEKTKERCEECGKVLYKVKNDLSNYRCHSRSIDCFPGDINKFEERKIK